MADQASQPWESQKDANEMKTGIDQIREIIFGETLASLQEQIGNLTQENAKLQKKISALEARVSESEKTLTENAHQISAAAENRQAIETLIDNLKLEFERKINQLMESKIDKSQIGQAFIEWGTRVKEEASK